MEYANLGASGLRVSRICLGMMTYGAKSWREWVLPEAEARPFVRRALDAGINFFDTADVYSIGESEVITGKLLKESGVKRDNLVVATKVNGALSEDPNDRGLSRKHIKQGIDNSLKRLGMDYIDLYQIHRFDPNTPIAETMEALHDVVREGKALYIGASSMSAWQFVEMQHCAERHGWTKFVSMQNHYNLVYREEEREMIPYCRSSGVGVIPWSPLARGFLAGTRRPDKTGDSVRSKSDPFANQMYFADADFKVLDAVAAIAKQRGVSNAQIALAWILHKPGVSSPIVGASKLYQLEEAIAGCDIKLSGEEIAALEAPYAPHPVLGH
jgi:1-deoxyxylulose-5-phosphate synthase